jgi:peptidoglycan hydrolase-like protein with peptidoglycan-binding domain
MKAWKTFLALALGLALAAGPALAQTSGGTTGSTTAPGSTGSSGVTGSTGTSAAPGSADTSKGTTDTGKSASDMKSDMKSGMKSMKHKAGRMMRGGHHEDVKAAQQALKDKGSDPGPVDGRMGPKTKAALKEFQKAQGLKETGRLDRETKAKLGLAESKTSASESTSPASASPSTSDRHDTMSGTAPSNTQNMGSDRDTETKPSGEAKPKVQPK